MSARGFELSYDAKTGSYEIRIFTPSAVADYETAFDYLKKLCAFLGNDKITTEDNETYTADTITAYNYKEQIGYALEAIYNNLKNSDHEHFEIFGLHRPVALNKKITKEIIKTKEAVENFSSFITNLQYIDAYSARQKIYCSISMLIPPDKRFIKKMTAVFLASIPLRKPFPPSFLLRHVSNMKMQTR